MLYIVSPELIHLATVGLYPFDKFLPLLPPLHPNPWAALLCSVSLTLAFLDSTYKWGHTVFVFLWLISLSTMLSRLIHVVTNGRIPFFLTAEQYSIACTGYIFIHSFIGGHLGCLHSLAIVNNAAMHKKENQISFSLVIYQEVGLLKYMGVLRLIFLEKNFFKFAFPWWLVMLNVFLCTYCLFACLLWKKISIQIPCPFLNLIALSSMSS